MEIRSAIHQFHMVRRCMLVLLFSSINCFLFAQPPVKAYKVKDGNMFITLGKGIKEPSIDSFIRQYKLHDLRLKELVHLNFLDSALGQGWRIVVNNQEVVVLSKPMMTFESIANPIDKLVFTSDKNVSGEVHQSLYGYNKFKNKYPFALHDRTVTFFLKNNKNARQVRLAGSFTRWQTNAVTMRKTDSGWIADVVLAPGKYWYKFIIDGDWIMDSDNLLAESDGLGNINSVYYKTNFLFRLPANTGAKRVYIAGSFNEWRETEILMKRSATGWELPLYLNKGTHTYKFIIDGNWAYEQTNKNRVPDGHGSYNSVLYVGKKHLFTLKGYTNAKNVVVSGSFNGWKDYELFMTKTATGWELPYALGPGNYEYKFLVDGKWMPDPANPITTGDDGNSVLIFEPNYTFTLKGYSNAKKVFLAGDLNAWNPNSFQMRKEGDVWKFSVHLPPGKHRYKFIVDGEWIRDPANKMWEENEFNNGNSVLWVENNAFIS